MLSEKKKQGQVLQRRSLTITMRIILGLMVLVLLGTILLMVPGVSTGASLTFMEALFTATSAVTVTGLTVVTTSSDFTTAGHLILLALIQVGGVGYMFAAAVALRLLGRRLSFTDRMTLSASLGLESPAAIMNVLKRSIYGLLLIESIGAALLYWHWRSTGIVAPERALLYAVFHAVSAFCNAGFDLFAGLPVYPAGLPGDNVTLIIMGILIFLGGLGIPVLSELFAWNQVKRFSLHTRLTLVTVTVLLLIGWLGLLIPEARGGVIHTFSWDQQMVRTLFQSVSSRTAGFPGFADFDNIGPGSQLLIMGLMFIGTAPASMGGGITTGSFAVLVLAVWSYVQGLSNVHVGGRGITVDTVRRASAVLTVSLGVVALATWLLLMTHSFSLNTALFEVISAFATCGLSLGITGDLNTFGRLIIIVMMFWGRLGALTIVSAIAERTVGTRHLVDYPEESVLT